MHFSCAPVIDVTKTAGSHVTWQEKYLGIVDTLGLVMYMLDFMKADSQDDFEKQVTIPLLAAICDDSTHSLQSSLIASFDEKTVADMTSAYT